MYLKLICWCWLTVYTLSAPTTKEVPPERQQPVAIPIISLSAEYEPNGKFKYSYETGNGIKRQETSYDKESQEGKQHADCSNEGGEDDDSGEIHVQKGSYSYTAPDGTVVSVRYIADENGFQPIISEVSRTGVQLSDGTLLKTDQTNPTERTEPSKTALKTSPKVEQSRQNGNKTIPPQFGDKLPNKSLKATNKTNEPRLQNKFLGTEDVKGIPSKKKVNSMTGSVNKEVENISANHEENNVPAKKDVTHKKENIINNVNKEPPLNEIKESDEEEIENNNLGKPIINEDKSVEHNKMLNIKDNNKENVPSVQGKINTNDSNKSKNMFEDSPVASEKAQKSMIENKVPEKKNNTLNQDKQTSDNSDNVEKNVESPQKTKEKEIPDENSTEIHDNNDNGKVAEKKNEMPATEERISPKENKEQKSDNNNSNSASGSNTHEQKNASAVVVPTAVENNNKMSDSKDKLHKNNKQDTSETKKIPTEVNSLKASPVNSTRNEDNADSTSENLNDNQDKFLGEKSVDKQDKIPTSKITMSSEEKEKPNNNEYSSVNKSHIPKVTNRTKANVTGVIGEPDMKVNRDNKNQLPENRELKENTENKSHTVVQTPMSEINSTNSKDNPKISENKEKPLNTQIQTSKSNDLMPKVKIGEMPVNESIVPENKNKMHSSSEDQSKKKQEEPNKQTLKAEMEPDKTRNESDEKNQPLSYGNMKTEVPERNATTTVKEPDLDQNNKTKASIGEKENRANVKNNTMNNINKELPVNIEQRDKMSNKMPNSTDKTSSVTENNSLNPKGIENKFFNSPEKNFTDNKNHTHHLEHGSTEKYLNPENKTHINENTPAKGENIDYNSEENPVPGKEGSKGDTSNKEKGNSFKEKTPKLDVNDKTTDLTNISAIKEHNFTQNQNATQKGKNIPSGSEMKSPSSEPSNQNRTENISEEVQKPLKEAEKHEKIAENAAKEAIKSAAVAGNASEVAQKAAKDSEQIAKNQSGNHSRQFAIESAKKHAKLAVAAAKEAIEAAEMAENAAVDAKNAAKAAEHIVELVQSSPNAENINELVDKAGNAGKLASSLANDAMDFAKDAMHQTAKLQDDATDSADQKHVNNNKQSVKMNTPSLHNR